MSSRLAFMKRKNSPGLDPLSHTRGPPRLRTVVFFADFRGDTTCFGSLLGNLADNFFFGEVADFFFGEVVDFVFVGLQICFTLAILQCFVHLDVFFFTARHIHCNYFTPSIMHRQLLT